MRKVVFNIFVLLMLIVLSGCVTKKQLFSVTEDGKKQYKNNEGIFVRDEWVELNGDKYYFDKNSYLVTNDWVYDEYFVDEDGKMKKDFWYNDGKSDDHYYLGEDGKYVKNKIVNIDNKKYAFDKNGLWIKNQIFLVPDEKDKYMISDKKGIVADKEGEVEATDNKYYIENNGEVIFNEWKTVNGKDAYYDENGKRVYNGFALLNDKNVSTDSEIKKWCYLDENGDMVKDQYFDVNGQSYYANEDAILISNAWQEYEGKKYYYGPDCYLLKNQIVDNVYYVDENGAMVINQEIKINGKTYSFGSDGRGNIKIIKKTSNDYWVIRNYTDTGKKYVTNKDYFHVPGFDYFQLLVDKNSFRLRMYFESTKNIIHKTEDRVYANIKIRQTDNVIIDNEIVEWDSNGYIIFDETQTKKIINALSNDLNELLVAILEIGSKDYKYGTIIEAKRFNEVYLSLF